MTEEDKCIFVAQERNPKINYFVFVLVMNNIENRRTEKSAKLRTQHRLVVAEVTTREEIQESNKTYTRINIKKMKHEKVKKSVEKKYVIS